MARSRQHTTQRPHPSSSLLDDEAVESSSYHNGTAAAGTAEEETAAPPRRPISLTHARALAYEEVSPAPPTHPTHPTHPLNPPTTYTQVELFVAFVQHAHEAMPDWDEEYMGRLVALVASFGKLKPKKVSGVGGWVVE